MRLGWLADPSGEIIGGAELSAEMLAAQAPGWTEIVQCPAGQVADDCHAYVIQNCFTYHADIIPVIKRRPVVKVIRDYWPHGDGELREWLLQNAAVTIFSSKPHYQAFPFTVGTKVRLCPPPVDIRRFRKAAEEAGERRGTFWMGQMFPHKGLVEAVWWAEANEPVDFYGEGPLRPRPGPNVSYMGQVEHEDVPALMASYANYLHLPQWIEPYGKTVIEAAAAGNKLIVNERIGALWWLENEPQAVEEGVERFWEIVKEAVI